MPRATLYLIGLAIAAWSPPAAAADGQGDTPACKHHVRVASSGVSEAMGRLSDSAKASDDQRCANYRQHFLVLVRARAIFAVCKSGPDRDASIVKLDGTIDNVNGAIAESCAIQ